MLMLTEYYNKYKYNIIGSSADILRLTNHYKKEANIYLIYEISVLCKDFKTMDCNKLF